MDRDIIKLVALYADRLIDTKQVNAGMDRWTEVNDAWIDGQTDGQIDEQTNKQTNGQTD